MAVLENTGTTLVAVVTLVVSTITEFSWTNTTLVTLERWVSGTTTSERTATTKAKSTSARSGHSSLNPPAKTLLSERMERHTPSISQHTATPNASALDVSPRSPSLFVASSSAASLREKSRMPVAPANCVHEDPPVFFLFFHALIHTTHTSHDFWIGISSMMVKTTTTTTSPTKSNENSCRKPHDVEDKILLCVCVSAVLAHHFTLS